jgi:4-amino-4-deoxy-L-arabinose transferase-like glycosyltransferase
MKKKSTKKSSRVQEHLAFAGILLLAAGLRLWKLEQNGFANTYYSAAVRSMGLSLHNFLYASFDPSGFVSVDKPPLALWIQVLSTKILGFGPLGVLLPQALEGIACVALVYHLVRRRFDAGAALIAGLAMAVGPICVAVDRYNNVDSCLLFCLLLATWAFFVATERASRRFLLLASALVGVAFNAKMLAAFVVLPTFYLMYFGGAPCPLRKRTIDLLFGSVVLVVVSLAWVLFVDLTPPSDRPYVGSTNDDSMMSLSLGWNGFQRLLVKRRGVAGREIRPVVSTRGNDDSEAAPRRGRGLGAGEPGPLRLAQKDNAGQITWMLPLVLIAVVFFSLRRGLNLPLSPTDQSLFLWSGWLLKYAFVLSFLRGPMHIYYLVMLAPPLAALTGIGARTLWLAYQKDKSKWGPLLFPGALALTALWQAYLIVQSPSVRVPLLLLLVAGMALSLYGLLRPSRRKDRWPSVGATAGLMTLFIAPFFWSCTPLLAINKGDSPEANPSLLTADAGKRQKEEGNSKRLLAFLKQNVRDERYLLVAQNIRPIAPLIIETAKPALALGGFMGRDPILNVEGFAKMASQNQFRYVMLSRPRRRGGEGRGGTNAEISKWVRAHGKLVDASEWRIVEKGEDRKAEETQVATGILRGWDRGLAQMDLYDLKLNPFLTKSGEESRE